MISHHSHRPIPLYFPVGNLKTVRFWAHHPNGNSGGSQIWVPDITTYNSRAKMADQVEGVWLEVSSSGGVYFSRPGRLDILCKFQGLVKFPFDRDVRCDLDMGGWMTGGAAQACVDRQIPRHTALAPLYNYTALHTVQLTQRLPVYEYIPLHAQGIFLAPGVTPGVDFVSSVGIRGDGVNSASYQQVSERSTGSTYVQYALTKVTANQTVVHYECCPNDPYPIMTFTFHIFRTTQMYAMLLVPLGFLTFLVNFAFFMQCDDNNRVLYCMTILLVIMVVKDMTYSLIPLTGEIMWIHIYLGFCEFICMMITVQSFVVFFLAKYTHAFLMPNLLMVYVWLCARRATPCVNSHIRRLPPAILTNPHSCAIRTTKGFRAAVTPKAVQLAQRRGSILSKSENKEISDLLADDMMHHQNRMKVVRPLPNETGEKVEVQVEIRGEAGGETTGKPQYPIHEAERLLKWEKIFYQAPQRHSETPQPLNPLPLHTLTAPLPPHPLTDPPSDGPRAARLLV